MTSGFIDRLRQVADPETPARSAYDICAASIPNGLFTAMRFHPATMEVERVHSTLPDVYPVSGRKPKRETAWGEKVLIRQLLNVGHGAGDIEWAFGDHEIILGLGLRAVLNVPVVRGERVLGTINYLRAEPAFDEEDCATGRILAAALALRGDRG